MKLIIAEKPSLGRSIADAIPGSANGRDPIYKGDYCITWLYGHILSLKEPQDYDEKYARWSLEQLPIYFPNWEQKASEGKEEKLNSIGNLLEKAELVIHAGDPDDEGQLLVDEVLRWFHYTGPVKRLDTANTTQAALSRALSKLSDNGPREIDGWAAYARSVADLMVGVNMSRFFTKNNAGKTLTVGRVQTPTLGLVVMRDLQIEGHEKVIYYTVGGELEAEGKTFPYTVQLPKEDPRLTEGRLLSPAEAQRIADAIRGKKLDPVQITSKIENEKPPLPFNLVKLQTCCGNTWGYDPQKVMDITQRLKDAGAITYNRSDCQYLSSDHFREAPKTTATVCANLGGRPEGLDTHIRSAAFNDKNITAHFAIIPTDTRRDLNRMTEEERNVYTIIAKYYLAQFLPPCKKKKMTLTAEVPGVGTVTAVSSEILEQGFHTLLPAKADPPTALSQLADGTYTGTVLTAEVTEKETRPPSRYTKTSLNEDMTRIAKYVEDEKVRRLLLEKDKDKKGENGSIGTSATRASIIDGLVLRGFLAEKGKQLISTELGREFYRILPDELKKPDMTAYWWVIQEKIKSSESPYTALPESVLETIRHILKQQYPRLKSAFNPKNRNVVGRCPRCGGYVIEGSRGYGCAGYREGCKFTIWKNPKSPLFKDVTVSPAMASALLEGDTLTSAKLYSPGKDVRFYGGFQLKDEGSDYGADLEYVPMERPAVGTCPRCGGDVIEGTKGFGCRNYKQGCRFTIWKNPKSPLFKNITINTSMVKKLLAGETVATKHLYSAKKDTEYYGGFRLKDEGGDYGADLELVMLERPVLGKCPLCGGDVVEGTKGFGCLNYQQGCKFTIWKKPSGSLFKKLTISETMAKKLLAGETVPTAKLFSEKKNTLFYGGIRLAKGEEGQNAHLELVMLERPPVGKCPRCGGDIVEGKSGFGCLNYKQGCKFIIWKNPKQSLFKKLTITESMAKKLLAGEWVESDKLYSESTDRLISGRFHLADKGGDYGPELEVRFPETTVGTCPRCGGRVTELPMAYRCSGYENGCRFIIWKKPKTSLFRDITVTSDMAKALLSGEAVKTDKLYSAKKDKNFGGSFRLKDTDGGHYPELELIWGQRKQEGAAETAVDTSEHTLQTVQSEVPAEPELPGEEQEPIGAEDLDFLNELLPGDMQ